MTPHPPNTPAFVIHRKRRDGWESTLRGGERAGPITLSSVARMLAVQRPEFEGAAEAMAFPSHLFQVIRG